MAIPTDNYKTTSVSYGKKDDVNPPDPVGGTPGDSEPASAQVVFRGSVFVDPVTNATKQIVRSFGDVNAQGALTERSVVVDTPELPLAASVITFAASASFAASAGELTNVLTIGGGGTGASTLASAQTALGITDSRDASTLQGKLPDTAGTASTIACRDGSGALVAAGVDLSGGDLTLSGCGQILLANGSVGGPGLAFASNTDLGMFRGGTNVLYLAAAGASAMRVTGTQISFNPGDETNPGITFMGLGGIATGFFSASNDLIGITCNNSTMFQVDGGSGVTITAPLEAQTGLDLSGGDLTLTGSGQIIAMNGCVSEPAYTFERGSRTTGFYSPATGELGITVFGSTMMKFDNASSVTVLALLVPGADKTFDLGTSTLLWDNVWASTYTSNGGGVGAPAFSFISDLDSGMYLISGGVIGFAANGSNMIQIAQGSAVSIRAPLVPAGDNAFHIGTPTSRWSTVRVASALLGSNLSILASDIIIKASGRNVQMAGSNITLSAVNVITLIGSGVDIAAGDLTLSGAGQILPADGSDSAPAYSFASDPAIGFHLSTTGRVVLSVDVASNIVFASAFTNFADEIRVPTGASTNPTYTFAGDLDTGLFHPAANRLGVAAAGSAIITIGSSTISALQPGLDLGTNLGSGTFRFNTIHASAVDATLFRGEATSAQYADLAERYEADSVYEPGTVMIFGGECEITPCTSEGDTRVAGVISTKPGFRMNAKAGPDDSHPFLALRGRVPCKVVGRIHKGALLTTSDVPGHAVRAFNDTPHWAVFAKALEKHDDEKGIIEVVVL